MIKSIREAVIPVAGLGTRALAGSKAILMELEFEGVCSIQVEEKIR